MTMEKSKFIIILAQSKDPNLYQEKDIQVMLLMLDGAEMINI